MSGLLNSTGAVSGILGSSVLPSGVTGGSGLDETPLSHRNMIINGDMQVAQRGDGTGITNAGSNYYGPDRYKFNEDGTMTAVVSITKETLTSGNAFLDGFNSAWKLDVTTADASVDAAIFTRLTQRFEKDNLARIGKGGASAKTCTLSFWVKATVTGVNVVEFFDQVNTRTSGAQYTINSSDTWEHKTVTFPADTSDPLGTGSGLAAEINFILQVGSNYSSGTGTGTGGVGGAWADSVDANRAAGHACNHFSSTSNNFHLTGIQLELGSNATAFAHRSYGDELRQCMRYYQRYGSPKTFTAGTYYHNSAIFAWCLPQDSDDCAASHILPVEMRTTPTASITEAHIRLSNNGVNITSGNTLQAQWCSSTHAHLHLDLSGTINVDNMIAMSFHSTAGYYDLSAEL